MLDTKRLLDQFLDLQRPNPSELVQQPGQSQSPLSELARNAGGMLSGNLGAIGTVTLIGNLQAK